MVSQVAVTNGSEFLKGDFRGGLQLPDGRVLLVGIPQFCVRCSGFAGAAMVDLASSTAEPVSRPSAGSMVPVRFDGGRVVVFGTAGAYRFDVDAGTMTLVAERPQSPGLELDVHGFDDHADIRGCWRCRACIVR